MAMSGKIREKGFALIGVLLFLVLLSAMAVTLSYTVRTEKRISGSDQEGNLAYYDAEAGMEKMTADLGALYEKTKSPTAATITDLGNDKPGLPDVGYNYVFNVQANPDGSPQKPRTNHQCRRFRRPFRADHPNQPGCDGNASLWRAGSHDSRR